MPVSYLSHRARIGMFFRPYPLPQRSIEMKNDDPLRLKSCLFPTIVLIMLFLFSYNIHSAPFHTVTLILTAGAALLSNAMLIFYPILRLFSNLRGKHLNPLFFFRCIILQPIFLTIPGFVTLVFIPFVSRSLLLAGDIHPNPGPTTATQNDIPVKVMFTNINSITAEDGMRFEQLKLRAKSESIDVIMVEESGCFDKEKIDDFAIENYHKPLHIDKNRGYFIYIHETLPLRFRQDLFCLDSHCIWLELPGQSQFAKMMLGMSYRSPSQEANARKTYFRQIRENISSVQSILNQQDSLLFVGDFNSRNRIWWDGDTSDTAGRELFSIASDLSLFQLINEPTHIWQNSKSCIDLMFTDSPGLIKETSVCSPIGGSDHNTLITTLDIRQTRPPSIKKKIWLYDEGNIEGLNQDIMSADWNFLHNNQIDVSGRCDRFTKLYFELIDRHIPSKTINIRANDQPWFNGRVKRELKNRERLFRKCKASNNDIDRINYVRKSKEVAQIISSEKERHENRLLLNLDNQPSCSAAYWKLINKFLGRRFCCSIPPLRDPASNRDVSKLSEKTELFLKTFTPRYHVPILNPIYLPHFAERTQRVCDQISTTSEEVRKYILKLDTSKACGPDSINNKMLKLTSGSISIPLAHLFNYIFNTTVFPSSWKLGHIVPIHKKGEKSIPSNYRPITLLSCISKLCEGIIYDRIYNHLSDNQLLYSLQAGFRKGHGTIDQLISITDGIHKELENGKWVRGVFLDISAAFDTVPHYLLVHKLRAYGLRGRLLKLIESYLSNRKFKVKIDDELSSCSVNNSVNAGVPQGSRLGPLLAP